MEEESSPLQPLADFSRKLKDEWEGIAQKAENASQEMFVSLKAQEVALVAERAELQSIQQETFEMRNSLFWKIPEQERKAFIERAFLERLSKTVQQQFVQVKEVQDRMANQLENLKSIFAKLKEGNPPNELIKAENMEPSKNEIVDNKSSVKYPSSLLPIKQHKQTLAIVKSEPINDDDFNVKQEIGDGPTIFNQIVRSACLDQTIGSYVKEEPKQLVTNVMEDRDNLDHALLSERLESMKHTPTYKLKPNIEELTSEISMDRGKRKGLNKNTKKCDVPIHVVLQEDAPGLLEKLMERGILDDIVVFDGNINDECGDSFGTFEDLECLAGKIWGSSGLIKFPVINRPVSSNTNKAMVSYDLSCLIFLIDQTKSLKQKNWPVDWGWCRELQAFIFVFEKHNRIVLEKPEYGNATYFFELIEGLPVQWQVTRLIRVLSVTALGKTALLENKPLLVGQDLTEAEAKILQGFGWSPNTGLGTFLNFCERVYHDPKDDDSMEWKQKFGKCLMDGYDRGRLAIKNVPQILSNEDVKPKLEMV